MVLRTLVPGIIEVDIDFHARLCKIRKGFLQKMYRQRNVPLSTEWVIIIEKGGIKQCK